MTHAMGPMSRGSSRARRAWLKAGYREMAALNLALAEEAVAAENETFVLASWLVPWPPVKVEPVAAGSAEAGAVEAVAAGSAEVEAAEAAEAVQAGPAKARQVGAE